MNFTSEFWNDVKNSFYNPSFYAEVKNRPLKKGVKNILFLNFIAGIVLTILLAMAFVPAYKALQKKDYVEQYYPSELTVTVKNGVASTTVPEPYFIKISETDRARNPLMQNYIVFNTQKDLKLDTINSYNSYVVVTQGAVMVRESNTKTTAYSLMGVENVVISKEKALNWERKILDTVRRYAVPGYIAFTLAIVFGGTLYWLSLMLLWAFVPLTIAKLKKKNLTYKEAYITGLYAVAPVLLLTIASTMFGFGLQNGVSFLLFVVVLVLNIEKENTSTAEVAE